MSRSRSVDSGYTTLVGFFQSKNELPSSLKPKTLFSAVTHYLTTIPLDHLTPFTHAIAASPNLWKTPGTRTERLDGFQASFRTAFNVKHNAEGLAAADYFFPQGSIQQAMQHWVKVIFAGITAQRRDPEVRLILLNGLLLALHDNDRLSLDTTRERIEGEAVICCAELMEIVQPQVDDWTGELVAAARSGPEDVTRTTTLTRVGTTIGILSTEKLILLDLEAIATLGLNIISETLDDGHFLKDFPSELPKNSEGKLLLETARVSEVLAKPAFTSFGSTSKLVACCITGLSYQRSTQVAAWNLMTRVCNMMEAVSGRIEGDWSGSDISLVTDEQDFGTFELPFAMPSTYEQLTTSKSLAVDPDRYFHLADPEDLPAILTTLTFESVPHDSQCTPHTLVSSVLNTFLHLAFVTSKFGGGLTSAGGGFLEQKRAFFTALDIIASNPSETALLIKRLHNHLSSAASLPALHPVRQAHASFFLACAEQLMPALEEDVIEHVVLPIAIPLLNEPSRRETYESAHSVVLSVFSSHAKRKDSEEGTQNQTNEPLQSSRTKAGVAQRLAPFYADCLLQNSDEGRLSPEQLTLAYSSLVNGARVVDMALTQLCVEKLLDALKRSKNDAPAPTAVDKKQKHRLQYVLISSISAVGAPLLRPLLLNVKRMVLEEADAEARIEMKAAVFHQVLDKMADAEKGVAMRWWLELQRDEAALEIQPNREISDGRGETGSSDIDIH
ncbi:hypothetical protein FRB98_004696 [Tulasnella sp. 332]|nr:hypothetical protein FRB98_004696 [Tulasnella sp. 332]